MRFQKMPKAEARPNDTPAMREAIDLLIEKGIDVRRPANSDHQLKLDGQTSYFPTKGTLYIDGEQQARPERGLQALEKWIAQHAALLSFG
ncbi:hypothetical protein CDQ92_10700 [Sphingopyxis bauzanensis]|uniref:Uncharacterized protein n=2 Tax=Sphingopyxis bauzanensis TaxID=651663 RepID=A0A246JWL7_9SPHN|nr:hypothetical protein [Sphingopyxis bauzanensis]OWQ97477.1 hypothetical protein CDQ92_10700 [Sphingopyxis bauzanensis]GGJ36153.1 hypothetical protein GCM10011393_03220 [Sphingopyxis bauzanensis]